MMAGRGSPSDRDRQLWRYGLEEKPRGGFRILPRRRWVVERTFAWLGLSRRFSKDYERLCRRWRRR
jgi:transposase